MTISGRRQRTYPGIVCVRVPSCQGTLPCTPRALSSRYVMDPDIRCCRGATSQPGGVNSQPGGVHSQPQG
eukprot:8998646-Pyramimonas_sp.AAC.1